MKLWNSEHPFPAFEELSYAPHIEYRDPHTFSEDGYHFLLGAAVIKHKGILRVSFAHSLRTENDDCTRLEEKFSLDDGKTWETDHILCENDYGEDLGYPATVELSDGSLLTVFYAHTGDESPAVIWQQKWALDL